MSFVELENVSVSLSGETVVENVTFAIEAGTLHFIVGPNGGGKTTIVRAMLGQVVHGGQIRVADGQNIRVGYVPQALQLDRNLPATVNDILTILRRDRPAFLGSSRAEKEERQALLERVGMSGKEGKLFGELSGGERQRILFGQAISPRPDLLVMDEPTSNMDAKAAAMVETIVGELVSAGSTVVWINHDLHQVSRIGGSATMISRTVVANGPAREVVAQSMAGAA